MRTGEVRHHRLYNRDSRKYTADNLDVPASGLFGGRDRVSAWPLCTCLKRRTKNAQNITDNFLSR
jgi:hypothetical protein